MHTVQGVDVIEHFYSACLLACFVNKHFLHDISFKALCARLCALSNVKKSCCTLCHSIPACSGEEGMLLLLGITHEQSKGRRPGVTIYEPAAQV